MIREMMTIPIRLKAKRAAANLPPSWVTSNSIIGILAVDQDPRKIKTLNRETPFLRKTAATGNAAYKGPAEKAPRMNANKEPLMPASLPMYRIIVSFGTQTSISPRRMKIGGIMDSISFRLSRESETAFLPSSGEPMRRTMLISSRRRKSNRRKLGLKRRM